MNIEYIITLSYIHLSSPTRTSAGTSSPLTVLPRSTFSVTSMTPAVPVHLDELKNCFGRWNFRGKPPNLMVTLSQLKCYAFSSIFTPIWASQNHFLPKLFGPFRAVGSRLSPCSTRSSESLRRQQVATALGPSPPGHTSCGKTPPGETVGTRGWNHIFGTMEWGV